MKTNRVGRTRVEVSALGFGGAPIGNLFVAIDDEQAHATVEAAWDGGVRYFDTAPHYGLGLSERRLGASLAARPREQYVVSTKVGRTLTANPAPTGTDLGAGGFAVSDELTREFDYSRDGIRRSLEDSLTRLGLDRIDIVYVHDPEASMDVALAQAIPALLEFREQGVIGAVGAGTGFVDTLLRFVIESDVDVVMVAGRWTLIDRSAAQLLATCEQRGVSVVVAAPFNSGILSQRWPSDDAHFDYLPARADVLASARAAARVCATYDVTLPHAAMQFPIQHPAVACAVAGMRTANEVRQDVAWATSELPPGLLMALETAGTH